MIRPDLNVPIPENIQAAHFIGIGGSGMSGLARMFLDRGIRRVRFGPRRQQGAA